PSAHSRDDARGIALSVRGDLGDLDLHIRILLGEGLDDLRLLLRVRGPDAPDLHGVRIALVADGTARAADDRAARDRDSRAGPEGLQQGSTIDHLKPPRVMPLMK